MGYRSLKTPARVLTWCMVVYAAVHFMGLIWGLQIADRLQDFAAYESATGERIPIESYGEGVIGDLEELMWLVGVLAFVPFFALAYRNLPGRTTPAWVIPLLCLFRPKRVANAIWQCDTTDKPPALLAWWWGAWVVTNWVITPADRLSEDANTVAEAQFATNLELAAEITGIGAAVLLIRVALAVTQRHAAAAAGMSLSPESRPAPAGSGRSPLASRT